MNIQNFLQSISSVSIDLKAVAAVEKAYAAQFPEDVQKIISCAGKGGFFEGDNFCRQLPLEDIVSAQKDLNVNFATLGILPLFDKGDNDYVVFNIRKKKWEMFNIVDEISFMTGESLEKLLK